MHVDTELDVDTPATRVGVEFVVDMTAMQGAARFAVDTPATHVGVGFIVDTTAMHVDTELDVDTPATHVATDLDVDTIATLGVVTVAIRASSWTS